MKPFCHAGCKCRFCSVRNVMRTFWLTNVVRVWLMAADSGLAPSLVASSEWSEREGPCCLTPRQILWVKNQTLSWRNREVDMGMGEEEGGLIAAFFRLQWFYNPYFKLSHWHYLWWDQTCGPVCVKCCCGRHFDEYSTFHVLGTWKVLFCFVFK